ncbi:MAG: hypothetical protein GQ582_00520 [Methyloprofundus sp.]|nr:hypothetical protein [Methyloprofundus sp.]
MSKGLVAGVFILGLLPCVAHSAVLLDTGNTSFGDHTNDSVTFNLTDLSAHTEVNLNFDLYIMDSWDANLGSHIDIFGFRIDGGVQSWLFGNFDTTMPLETNEDSSWVNGNYNGVNDWGEIDRFFSDYADGFTISHTGSTLNLEFFGSGLQEISDESWRVENVLLTTNTVAAAVPEPIVTWFFSLGLIGLIGVRRKTKLSASYA